MDRQEFLTAFREIAPSFHWLNDNPLRAFAPGSDRAFCPLTALHYARSGQELFTSEAMDAAATLGLPVALAELIMDAADRHQSENAMDPTLHAELREAIRRAA
jgi:hypothetical protein